MMMMMMSVIVAKEDNGAKRLKATNEKRSLALLRFWKFVFSLVHDSPL
jgi:hypothetical protein